MLFTRVVPLLAGTLACHGCVSVTTADGQRLALTSTAFASYVERVFREQNRIADALAFALEGEAAGGAELIEAEQALLTACAGVNELATARRDGDSLGLKRSAANARSVPTCERAAQAAARLLPKS
jgi:hypothetical protein